MERIEVRESFFVEVLEWEAPKLVELGTVGDMTEWNGSVTVE